MLPFGLKGVTTTFKRLMNLLMNLALDGLQNIAVAYLDDIVNHIYTWKEHVGHLKQVLDRLDEEVLKVEACRLGMLAVLSRPCSEPMTDST